METLGHESEAVNVAGLKAAFQQFKTGFLDAGLSGKVSTSTYNQAVQRINDIEAVIGSASGDDDSVINKVREMIDFFANIPETDTLSGTLSSLNTAIGGKVDKVNGKGLSTNDYDNTAKDKVDAIPANPKYTDTTYSAATTSADGLMSSTDKKKLDGIDMDEYRQMLEDTVGFVSKNIIPFPYSEGQSKTSKGITFTVNDDGSIVVNGTATDDISFNLVANTPEWNENAEICKIITKYDGKKLLLSGGQNLNSNLFLSAQGLVKPGIGIVANSGDEREIIVDKTTASATDGARQIYIRVLKDAVCDNVVVFPMLRLANVGSSDDFEKYNPSVIRRINEKQDAINDLSAIRSGAALGATALQSHQDITGKEDKSKKVTTISSSSTDDQYPSAKAVHDALQDVSDTRISMQEFVAQGVAGKESNFDNRASFAAFSTIRWNSIKDQVKLDYTPVPIGDPQLKNIIVGLYGGETGGNDYQCYVRGVPGIKGEITVSQAAVVYLPGSVFKDVRGIRSFPEKSYFFEVRFGSGGIAEYEGDTLEEVELGYWDRYHQRMPFLRTEKPALRKIVINCDVCEFWYNHFIDNAPKLEYIEAKRLKVVGNTRSYAFLRGNTNVTKLSFPAVEECYLLERAAEKLKVVDLGENVHTVEAGFLTHYANEPTVLESVIVRAVTPPKVVNSSGDEISDTTPLNLYSGAAAPTLYVPDTSVSAYKAHSCWKLGWADIKGISEYSE